MELNYDSDYAWFRYVYHDDAACSTLHSKRCANSLSWNNSYRCTTFRNHWFCRCDCLWYMKSTLNKSLARGETFADYEVSDTNVVEVKKEIPSFFISILPIVLLIFIILMGSAFKIPNIILIALAFSVIVSALFFNKYIPSQKTVINEGASSSIMPVFLTSSTVAFGVVITLAPGFKYISEFILGIPGDPLISLSIASAAFGAITGSASGSLGIVMEAFAQNYLAMGINPEVIHRVATVSSAVFTVMP